jgi:hypothetical protein
MKTQLNNPIKPFDIIYKEYAGEFGQESSKHYYVCIYTQSEDENNRLYSDIYGLMITTNKKYENIPNDYNVRIEINDVQCYVLCDKIFRFKIEQTMEVKDTKLTVYEKSEIKSKFDKFIKEVNRQMEVIKK